jgi:hypothetical protein
MMTADRLGLPGAHRNTTAGEIWADSDGKVDFLISGVGTGGAGGRRPAGKQRQADRRYHSVFRGTLSGHVPVRRPGMIGWEW